MQQRRVRLGDVLDDYCPRERRITNHAVVAMIEDDVKQTRCSTCDAEHEYKHGKAPASRRKKPIAAAAAGAAQVDLPESPVLVIAEEVADTIVEATPAFTHHPMEPEKEPDPPELEEPAADESDEWPVHRPLIRATLPRPEGQTPERKPTDFTIRQPGGRFDGQRNGDKSRGNRHARHAQGQSSGHSRFGGSRNPSGSGSHQGGQHAGNSQRQGNRQGPSPGQRGGRPGPGPGTGGGNRPGGPGRGPKRGR